MESKITIANTVKNRIIALEEGFIFSYMDFEGSSKNGETIIKTLNRLVEKGKIEKLSKGRYWKPIVTNNRTIQPRKEEFIKDLLVKNGEIIGYETGFNAVSKTLGILENKKILIGRNSNKSSMRRGGYSIEFVLQRNEITEENIVLLQILDCLKMIKGLRNQEKDDSLGILWRILRKFNKTKIEKLVKYSAKYPSSTRALLGFLLEDNKKTMELVEQIRETLNPISKYQLGIRKLDDFLKEKWNLK
jgi:hypothetical protein